MAVDHQSTSRILFCGGTDRPKPRCSLRFSRGFQRWRHVQAAHSPAGSHSDIHGTIRSKRQSLLVSLPGWWRAVRSTLPQSPFGNLHRLTHLARLPLAAKPCAIGQQFHVLVPLSGMLCDQHVYLRAELLTKRGHASIEISQFHCMFLPPG